MNDEGIIMGFAGSRDVYIAGRWLDPEDSQKLRNHSPDGFMWGYGGSGPAQCALGILLSLAGPEIAQAHYQQFKREVVAMWDKDKDFEYPVADAREWLRRIAAARV